MSEIDINYQKGYTKGFIDGESKYLDFIVKQEQLRKPDPIILKCSEFEKCPLKEEKWQREQGCEYCKERKPILDDLGQLQIDDTDNTIWFISQVAADDIYEDHTNINYCPMCGRRLSHE